jgi:hypothetical protein
VATATPTLKANPKTRALSTPLARWHLLSLDAPTIAALWTWFIATANHIILPAPSIIAMAIAVWMLYAADRLMDARLIDAHSHHTEPLEDRHRFHHLHRTRFLVGILIASAALATLLPHLEPAALRLYLILGAILSAYFILIHTTRTPTLKRLPKEIAVGIFFSAATFIPTISRQPHLRLALLPSALLFATLCSLNCLFIYDWEHPTPHSRVTAHLTTHLALRHLILLASAIIITACTLAILDSTIPRPLLIAYAISAALLLLLHHQRHTIQPITLRAAADLALATPLLVIPFLNR